MTLKLTLILSFSMGCILISIAQSNTVQIRLLDAEVGEPIGDSTGYIPESSDNGLNEIFADFNASQYFPGFGFHPYPDYENRIHFVLCNCDIVEFAQALRSYTAVVDYAEVSPINETFSDVLNYRITQEQTASGEPTGELNTNGNVLTTNNELNEVFDDYTVYVVERTFPNSDDDPFFSRVYRLACDCNVVELKSALDDLPMVIENTSYEGFAILSSDIENKVDFQVFPNPTSGIINATNPEVIAFLKLNDLSGRALGVFQNLDLLNQKIETLKTGYYILQIHNTQGQKQVFKILKK